MSNNNRNDSSVGCLVWMVIAVIAMPFYGLYLIGSGDEEKKILGVALFVVGCILYVMMSGS